MNIFYLDDDIQKCVEYHCDKHVVKMILESAQMLCTVCSEHGIEVPYRPVHKKHPCTLWAGKSASNWRWLRDFALTLNEEYKYRYEKTINHKSAEVIKTLYEPNLSDFGITPRPKCVTDPFRNLPVIEAYREYYKTEKASFCTWKKRPVPDWFK